MSIQLINFGVPIDYALYYLETINYFLTENLMILSTF